MSKRIKYIKHIKGLPLDEKRKRLSYAIKEMLGAM